MRATALFADGVYHMRRSRLIDAKAALQGVLSLVGDGAALNEQVIRWRICTRSGRDQDSRESRTLGNTVRAKRQRYK